LIAASPLEARLRATARAAAIRGKERNIKSLRCQGIKEGREGRMMREGKKKETRGSNKGRALVGHGRAV
jgi:hypothetical protein